MASRQPSRAMRSRRCAVSRAAWAVRVVVAVPPAHGVPVLNMRSELSVFEDTSDDGEGTTHTEIQYLLFKLGSDMGLDVYVANNDRSREWKGKRLGDLPRMRQALPQQFDPATNKIIQLIDVLWLEGNAIVAAFEVESTTSIYSGLLRMSDLVSMPPSSAT